ncbi:MAG: T9SS type A sorting domain-containing protein [Calditrichaeota bacterium]|nr:T9SS type A sorting domain-containing protein [Calditrichota bacterium]
MTMKHGIFGVLWLVLGGVLINSGLFAQQTVILQGGVNGYQGAQDAHILADKPENNTGAETFLEVTGNGAMADAKFALLRFDLSHLPRSLEIDRAELQLYLVQRRTEQSVAKTLAVYRLKKPWGEGQGDDPGGYDGRPARTGECSWLAARQGSLLWDQPGADGIPADRQGVPVDSLVVTPDMATGQWLQWNLTPLVQFWLVHPDSNMGLVVREPVPAAGTGILDVASREYFPEYFRPVLKLTTRAEDRLVLETAQLEATVSEVRITLPFWGDDNRNGQAFLRYRPENGDWSAEQSLQRGDFRFQGVLSGLQADQTYEVEIRATDNDGVVGPNPQRFTGVRLQTPRLVSLAFTVRAAGIHRVTCELQYRGDANRNGRVELWYRLRGDGDWIPVGVMSREDSLFRKTIYGLQENTTYEVQARITDPDGVDGQAVWTTTVTTLAAASAVYLDSLWQNGFRLISGGFEVFYEAGRYDDYILISPLNGNERALATRILNAPSLNLTAAEGLKAVTVNQNEDSIVVRLEAERSWGQMVGQVVAYRDAPGLLRFVGQVQAHSAHPIDQSAREFRFYHRGRDEWVEASPRVFASQVPLATGFTFLVDQGGTEATILYFQNFSRLNPYFERLRVKPRDVVQTSRRDFGYLRAVDVNQTFPNSPLILTDAFLKLYPDHPRSEDDVMLRYLEGLAQVLRQISVPPVMTVNWQEIARKSARDLKDPSCWVQLNGKPFLRAYVDITRFNSAEMIAQLDVLVPLKRYENLFGELSDLDETLSATLPYFFNQQYQTIVNDYPNEGITEGDSWYTMQLHMGLSALAKMGDSTARRLLLQSIPVVIDLAHNVNYEFPVKFAYAGNQPLYGSEPDAVGGYAYLMLDVFELTGDSTYLREAIAGISHFEGKGFDLMYEVHMSAIGAAACARLYAMTGDPWYLGLSYVALANIFRLTWMWECDYGYGQYYQTFMGLSPMKHSAVITPKEQYETVLYLLEYSQLVGGIVPEFVQQLIQAFVEQSQAVLYYTYPPHLPLEVVHTDTARYGSLNHPDLYIPLEDLREGWEKSGQIGQEIYGAGTAFAMATVENLVKIADAETPEVQRGKRLSLRGPFPNPFNDTTEFVVQIHDPQPGARFVELKIFNILGQEIYRQQLPVSKPTTVRFRWQGKNAQKVSVASGIYFYRIAYGQASQYGKLMLVR